MRTAQGSRSLDASIALIPLVVWGGSFAVLLVLPYYFNGLQQLPVNEAAIWSRDLQSQLPYAGGMLGVVWPIAALCTLMLAPVVVLWTAVWSAVLLWSGAGTRHPRGVATLVAAFVCAISTAASLVSPFGSALITWWMD